MKRKLIVKLLTICICVTLIGVVTVSALSSEKVSEMVSNFFAAGQYFKQANDSKGNSTNTQDAVLAKYKDTAITALTVEYQKNMNIIRSEELANKNQTDRDVIDNIIENLILLEEAERLGLAATEDEVEAMIENTRYGYSVPDGKKIIDDFCAGADITFEEYLEILRSQLPRTIARQKLIDAVGNQFCKENGLTFTKVNPPKEMMEAQEKYVKELVEKNQKYVEYFLTDTTVS